MFCITFYCSSAFLNKVAKRKTEEVDDLWHIWLTSALHNFVSNPNPPYHVTNHQDLYSLTPESKLIPTWSGADSGILKGNASSKEETLSIQPILVSLNGE